MAGYNFIIDTGVVVEDTASLQSDVLGEFRAALGASINSSANTAQGTLMAAEVLARTYVMKNNADLSNVINPNLSHSTFLDAICALTGATRGKNQSTVATGVQVAGPGNGAVTIPANSRIQTQNGDIFYLQSAITIPSNNPGPSLNNNAVFVSEAYGPIPFPNGTITILDDVVGWGTTLFVAGTTSVALGAVALQDTPLKIARLQQLASLGVGSSAAIMGAVSKVPNVTSVSVVENNTGQFATAINGVTFTLPSAMWVCVDGAATQTDAGLLAIAEAMYTAHNGGCPWDFGATGMGTPVRSPNGIEVTDPSTGLQYYVKLTTPIYLDGYVNITVHQANSSTTLTTAVQNAIMNYAQGLISGYQGLVNGQNLSAFEIAGMVVASLPGIYVKSCSVATVSHGAAAPTSYTSEATVTPFQRILMALGQINVTVV